MNSFTTNKIFFDAETVAEQLRSARQERGLKLEKISKELNINIKYLTALEKGSFDLLPAGVYGKNFLREYAIYLRLDYRPLIKMFENEVVGIKQKNEQELFSKQVVTVKHFLLMPKIIKNLIITFLVVICLIYLSYSLSKIVSPPNLVINTPPDNTITKSSSVLVSGSTEGETQLVINEQPVIIDKQGRFNEEVNLKKGINIITITAQKKYGRSKTEKRQILAEY